ncbi:TIGR04282 family arsenosugar biosynthesis glycosyltransferase [Saccharothrix sp. Mg75]|uniref:TIGR04282 family arsenosugar biosynthesis glycosyltransferase n=1 Tax=Saccharothrix sp. Mg75 TaxID=3445357 RepID=UPI003EF002A3
MTPVSLLVVAKAPVPGLAKTRLCPPASPEEAADLAAAALLDTLDAVLRTPGARPVVALTGDLGAARREDEVRAALRHCVVVPQRGDGFGERLANAHADAHRAHGLPVFQIGMDTPQVTPALLGGAIGLLDGHDVVVGPALDGGWWALGLREPALARRLADVPMSRDDTGVRTVLAFRDRAVGTAPALSDVDDVVAAREVADAAPGTRFAEAFARLGVAR